MPYEWFVGMSLHISVSEAVVGAAVARAISASFSNRPDPLLVAAECETEDEIPARLKQIEIATRMAAIDARINNSPGWGGDANGSGAGY